MSKLLRTDNRAVIIIIMLEHFSLTVPKLTFKYLPLNLDKVGPHSFIIHNVENALGTHGHGVML